MFWIASSCPTIIRRKLPSRASASRPVRVGSKGTLTRDIFFWAPFTTTPYFPRANWMPYFGTTVKGLIPGLCWSNFYPADQGPFRHSQQHEYNLPNIVCCNLPVGFRRSGALFATKACIDASWHNVSHSHVVIAMIQHHCLAQAVQSELGSVVSRSTRKCVLSCQATYIDDVAAATILQTPQRLARAIKRARQICFNALLPIFHCEFRCPLHYAHACIVHQNVGTARFSV